MKIAINRCYGGFSLSNEAVKMAVELGCPIESYNFDPKKERYKIVKDFGGGWKIYGEEKFGSALVKNDKHYSNYINSELRNDPILIKTIEKLGEKANGEFAKIEIVEIPDDIQWEINDYDGSESIHEKHRSW